jgi:LytS/YehU family sensor histidine kinase
VGIAQAQLPTIDNSNSSFGLAHVRERLATVYGSRGTLQLDALPAGGTRAILQIPLNT